MYVLVLNQNNLVQDGQNNKLIYKFPNSVNLTNKYIAVSSVTMFYSWFNISEALQNNKITYTWGATSTTPQTTYTITIPDGLYEIFDINSYCQFIMIANGTYWSDSNFNYYPFDLKINATRYGVALTTYYINSASYPSPAYTAPPAGWPTVPQNSIVTFPANFNNIVGYPTTFASAQNLNNATALAVPQPIPTSANNYYTANSAGIIQYLSNSSPQVQPNSNLLLAVSNINNPYSQPSSIIYSLTPSVAIGQIINDRPPNFMWNKMIDGTYNQIQLNFLGSNLQPLPIRDPSMTILLVIRDKDEVGLSAK
jgi:hypothetical protein